MEEAARTFTTLFSRALEENFPERHCRVVQLRYGLIDGRYHTLEQIAERYHLTRERIRQMVAKSLRIIRMRGRKNLAQGNTTRACAALLLYVQQLFKQEEPGYLDRMIAFAQGALPHLPQQSIALPLLVSLLCPLEQESGCLRDLLERSALEAARGLGPAGEKAGTPVHQASQPRPLSGRVVSPGDRPQPGAQEADGGHPPERSDRGRRRGRLGAHRLKSAVRTNRRRF